MRFADIVSEIVSNSKSNKEALNKEITIIYKGKKKKIKSFCHESSKMIIELGDK
jgi:hypothetical protein